jgi:hypothetical protein
LLCIDAKTYLEQMQMCSDQKGGRTTLFDLGKF